MVELKGYKIPIVGIPDGLSIYSFEVDEAYFDTYQNELLSKGSFEVKLSLDKLDNMFILNFEIHGSIATECDRCLADIKLPILSNYKIIVKLDEEQSDDPDVDHIPVDSIHLDIANYLYDFLVISVPLVKTYDCESEDPKPCDSVVLESLNSDFQKSDPGIWDDLKNIKVNK